MDVTAVLGRAPVDDFESAEVLITRNAEILAADHSRYGRDPEPVDPEPPASEYTPPAILAAVVEHALLDRGWRLEHPAIRGVLIGPNGERVDAMRTVTRSEAGFDLEALRAILRPKVAIPS